MAHKYEKIFNAIGINPTDNHDTILSKAEPFLAEWLSMKIPLTDGYTWAAHYLEHGNYFQLCKMKDDKTIGSITIDLRGTKPGSYVLSDEDDADLQRAKRVYIASIVHNC